MTSNKEYLKSFPFFFSAHQQNFRAPAICHRHQWFFHRHQPIFQQHHKYLSTPANFQSTSLFPVQSKLVLFKKWFILSAPAFCQRHHCSFQRHQQSFQQHQPFSPQFSATLRLFRSSPQHFSTPAPAGARKCCVEVRRAADNRHVLRRTAENMSKNHM